MTHQRLLMYDFPMRSNPPASVADAVLVQRFQAVAEETRLAIVRLLAGGERCVCDLQVELGAAQSRLSFHLKKLKDAGILEDRREGRWVYYRLVPDALDEMRGVLGELTPPEREGWSGPEAGCCR